MAIDELVVVDEAPTVIVDPELYAEARRVALGGEPEPATPASRSAPTG
jgi:hypothetical protein